MNRDHYYPIATIELLINTTTEQDQVLGKSMLDTIAKYLDKEIHSRLDLGNEGYVIQVSTEWKRGCLLEIINIGAVVVGAVYLFIKDYGTIRKNVPLLLKDLKGAFLTTTSEPNDEDPNHNIELVELWREAPEEWRKYFEAGMDVIVSKESVSTKETPTTKETIRTIHKIAVRKSEMYELPEEVIEQGDVGQ